MSQRIRPTCTLAAAVVACGALFAAAPVSAGECPKDKVLTSPRMIEEKPDIGVKRETLDSVALKGWRAVGDLHLRLRKLTIAKGGIVPTHQHDDRPSIVIVLNGSLIEHSATCAVPILHRAGDVAAEFGPQEQHWWENNSGEDVVVLSADVIPPEYFDPGTSPKHDM